MHKKAILLALFLFLFIPVVVFADCDDCSPSNCSSCGCELSNGKCVYSNFSSNLTSCGNGYLDRIPKSIPKVTSIIYVVIEIAVPVLLVLFCMIDLIKALSSGKDDDIKKNQKLLVKRLIIGLLVFFVFVVVKFVISIVADDNGGKIMSCTSCFISNNCDK